MRTKTWMLGGALLVGLASVQPAEAGNDRLMAIKQAEIVACRALVESVYGVKVRANSEVKDLVNGIFEGSAETKTKGTLRGYKLDKVFDEKKGVAKVTASISLKQVSDCTGMSFPNPDKEIRRIGFSTIRAEMKGAISALRAAELDAYGQLAEQIVGMDVEGKSSVRNMVLQSDTIKAKVVAALFLTEMADYGWQKNGDAYITLRINVDDVAKILGEKLNVSGMVEATGNGAAVNDYKGAAEAEGSAAAAAEAPRPATSAKVEKDEPMPPAVPVTKN
jgi:hypothetical protein